MTDIRRATRKHYSAEDKIRIVLELQRVTRRTNPVMSDPPKLMIHCQPWETLFRGKVSASRANHILSREILAMP